MRPRVVAKYAGQLGIVLAVLMAPSVLVALASGELAQAGAWAVVALGVGGVGLAVARLPAPGSMQVNEGMVVVALIFLVAPLTTSVLLMPAGLTFVDALFEAVSGVTTTGLTTARSLDTASYTFLFSRAWMQWYGGLGFVVLSLAIVIAPGTATTSLAATQSDPGDLVGGMHAHARRALVVYVALTALAVAGLCLTGAAPFTALLYALAAVSTGGFAPAQNSLAGVESVVTQSGVTLVCLAGAVPLALWDTVVRRRRGHELHVLQLRALLAATLVGMVALAVSLRLTDGLGWAAVAHHAPMLAASAQSTTGFSTIDVAGLGPASKVLVMLAMMVGGGAGSTAGGIKLLRVLIAIRLIQTSVVRTLLPSDAVLPTRLHGRLLDGDDIRHALTLIVLFIGVVVVSWIPFLLAGHDPLNALFEVVSATGTVGLSAGVTSADLATPLKLILCADMLLGRLEIMAWLVLLYPGTWWGHRRRTA